MDDEERVRERIATHLVQKGYEVLGVGSPDQALDAIRRDRFDVFLTDCNIPGVDEVEFLIIDDGSEDDGELRESGGACGAHADIDWRAARYQPIVAV
jgi:CheY-like chemotaxis protein